MLLKIYMINTLYISFIHAQANIVNKYLFVLNNFQISITMSLFKSSQSLCKLCIHCFAMPCIPRTGWNQSDLVINYVKEVTEPDDLPNGVTLTRGNEILGAEWNGAIIVPKGRRL